MKGATTKNQLEEVVFGFNENTQVSHQLDGAIQAIERICRPVIRGGAK